MSNEASPDSGAIRAGLIIAGLDVEPISHEKCDRCGLEFTPTEYRCYVSPPICPDCVENILWFRMDA